MKKKVLILIVDILVLTGAFLYVMWVFPGTRRILPIYLEPYPLFLVLWVGSSLLFDKYYFRDKGNRNNLSPFLSIFLSNFLVLLIVGFGRYFFGFFGYSYRFLFYTIFITSGVEFLFITARLAYRQVRRGDFYPEPDTLLAVDAGKKSVKEKPVVIHPVPEELIPVIEQESGKEVLEFISSCCNLASARTIVISTTNRFNILSLPPDHYKTIINLKRINDIQRINKFFEAANERLTPGGGFIGCVETFDLRKARILNRHLPVISHIVYVLDFFYHRILPKIRYTQKLYFFLTQGKNRLLSRAEVLGRLYSCGFEVLEEKVINDQFYFVTRKVRTPYFDQNPSYGPLIKLKRIGRDGKIIGVYKMRTMHAYSEYLQQYVYEKNNLEEGGKFSNDFRITTLGKLMRKTWIDELPMLINLVKGDLKLVGVRPLSEQYFSLYDPELQQKRILYRPGLVPPYYAEYPTPKTLEEVMANENRYLAEYQKHPFATDWKYFWWAFYNILFRHSRSK